MGKETIEVFSKTEGDLLTIFRSDQRDLPEEEQHPAVTAIRRPPDFDISWTTHLSAMRVRAIATEYLGVLHGVSVSYGRAESAPTATYTTSLISPRVPLKALSRLIAETTAFYGLPTAQIEEHLATFINPPVSSKT